MNQKARRGDVLLLSAGPVEAACCVLEHELNCVAVCSHNNSGARAAEVEWHSRFMVLYVFLFEG